MLRWLVVCTRRGTHSDNVQIGRHLYVSITYRLCEYGKFNSPGLGRGRPRSTTPEVQEEILEAVNMTPSISTRRVALQVNVPHTTVWRLLKEYQFVKLESQRNATGLYIDININTVTGKQCMATCTLVQEEAYPLAATKARWCYKRPAVEVSKEIGLEVNPEKTNYTIISGDENIVRNGNIKIGNVSFEEVEKFKYLEAIVTNINDTQEEIKHRINMENACYYSVEKLLSSLLSKNLKLEFIKQLYYRLFFMVVKLGLSL
ncbi:hypothetical protein ANN_12725 [Periplaneta americana]|uniref:Uncharacterized protein n=1 Tax=Periplaneta americana TaxID=6978 RepID=A0ABQ8THY7_PERAM|nr:hypothetical protein ANN_12725 [Periplaneta americana]